MDLVARAIKRSPVGRNERMASAVALYLGGASLLEAGDKAGIGRHSLTEEMRRRGQLRPAGAPSCPPWTNEQTTELVRRHVQERQSIRRIANSMGRGFDDCRRQLRRAGARVELKKAHGEEQVMTERLQRAGIIDRNCRRCSCGLLLPCNDCVPTAYELAVHRRPPDMGRYPEGGL